VRSSGKDSRASQATVGRMSKRFADLVEFGDGKLDAEDHD
jgi:hypothetical protein